VNEKQIEMLTNLVTNPYAWVFFIFTMSLPYTLIFIRRFYPEKLRDKMEKEEACTLKYNQKPEVKLYNNLVLLGMSGSVVISYFISYYLVDNVDDKLRLSINIFSGMVLVIIVIIGIYEYITRKDKDKDCSEVIVGYRYLKFPNIILTVAIFCFVIFGLFYLIGLIF